MVEHLIVFNAEAPGRRCCAWPRRPRRFCFAFPEWWGFALGRPFCRGLVTATSSPFFFSGPEVVERYRDHPLHVAFADQVFRPLAKDRLTTDYRVLLEVPPCGS